MVFFFFCFVCNSRLRKQKEDYLIPSLCFNIKQSLLFTWYSFMLKLHKIVLSQTNMSERLFVHLLRKSNALLFPAHAPLTVRALCNLFVLNFDLKIYSNLFIVREPFRSSWQLDALLILCWPFPLVVVTHCNNLFLDTRHMFSCFDRACLHVCVSFCILPRHSYYGYPVTKSAKSCASFTMNCVTGLRTVVSLAFCIFTIPHSLEVPVHYFRYWQRFVSCTVQLLIIMTIINIIQNCVVFYLIVCCCFFVKSNKTKGAN